MVKQTIEIPKRKCACGRREVSRAIAQERMGRHHFRIHDVFECYEVNQGRTVWRKAKQ